jgi:hypothetical protein
MVGGPPFCMHEKKSILAKSNVLFRVREAVDGDKYRQPMMSSSAAEEAIRVVVRVRPLNEREQHASSVTVVKVPDAGSVQVPVNGALRQWPFDRVFDGDAGQVW